MRLANGWQVFGNMIKLQSRTFCNKETLDLNKTIRKLAKTNWSNEHSTQIVNLYEQLKQSGIPCDPSTYFTVQNALIHIHSQKKDTKQAQSIWIELTDDDNVYRDSLSTFSCTAMMKIFRSYDHHKMVLRIFDTMPRLCVNYDSRSFTMAISAAAKLKWKYKAKQIHDKILQHDASLMKDEHILHGLMNMYFKCGENESAQQLWDIVYAQNGSNIHMWTILMSHYVDNEKYQETLDLFDALEHKNLAPDALIYNLVIQAITGLKSLERAHSTYKIIKDDANADIMCNVQMVNALLGMFGKCGDIDQVNAIWDDLKHNNASVIDVVTCNTTMNANLHHNKYEKVFAIFHDFQDICKNRCFQRKGRPNSITYLKYINAIAKMKDGDTLQKIKDIYALIASDDWLDLYQDTLLCSSLINVYSMSGEVQQANYIWNNLKKKDIHAFASIIDCNYHNDEYDMVLNIYDEWLDLLQTQKRMRVKAATKRIYLRGIQVCTHMIKAEKGQQIHLDLMEMYENGDIHTEMNHALIKMYNKFGDMENVERVWDSIDNKDVVSFNVMMSEYNENKNYAKVFELFDEMQNYYGIKPISTTYVHILIACGAHKTLIEVIHRHILSENEDMIKQKQVISALITAYGRCGDLTKAQDMWETYSLQKGHDVTNAVSWSAIITACVENNELDKAVDLFRQLQKQNTECAQMVYKQLKQCKQD